MTPIKKFLAALGTALLLALPASADGVQQSGTVTPGHASCWTTSGVLQDCGVSTNGYTNTLGITANGGTPFCIQNTKVRTAAYYQLCMGINSSAATINVTGFGASAPPLQVVIDGVVYPFSSSAGIPTVSNVTALRAATAILPEIFLLGYSTTGDGGNGTLYYDQTDTSTADNSCTVFVDAAGHRYKRNVIDASVSVGWCGAKVDGSTDDYTAWKNAVAAVGSYPLGGTVIMPSGTSTWASCSMPSFDAISVGSNVTLAGVGKGISKLQLTGACDVHRILKFQNVSNDTIRDITIIGNNANTHAGQPAIWFDMSSSVVAEQGNYNLINVELQNFAQDYWVLFENDSSGSLCMRHIQVKSLSAVSFSGNDVNSQNIAQPADVMSFQGVGGSSASACVEDILVEDGYAEGTYIKKYAGFWSGTQNFRVHHNRLINFGQGSADGATADGAGAYAVISYGNDFGGGGGVVYPVRGTIDGNQFISPKDAGWYCVGASSMTFTGNTVSGLTSVKDSTLPKGGAAVNQCGALVTGNWMTGSTRNIAFVLGTAGSMEAVGNTIDGSVASQVGIQINGTVNSAVPPIKTSNNIINLTGAGTICYLIRASATAKVSTVESNNDRLSCTSEDVFMDDTSSGSVVAQSITFSGTYLGGAIAVDAILALGTPSVPIILTNMTIDGTSFTSNPDGILLAGTKLTIKGIHCLAFTTGTGHCLNLVGAQGTMEQVDFQGVTSTRRATGSSMGLAKPTWSWDQGGVVQNLAAACSAGSATPYWQNDDGATTWTTRVATCS